MHPGDVRVGSMQDAPALAALAAGAERLSFMAPFERGFAQERLRKVCGGALQAVEVIALEQIGMPEATSGEASAEEFRGAGAGSGIGHD